MKWKWEVEGRWNAEDTNYDQFDIQYRFVNWYGGAYQWYIQVYILGLQTNI